MLTCKYVKDINPSHTQTHTPGWSHRLCSLSGKEFWNVKRGGEWTGEEVCVLSAGSGWRFDHPPIIGVWVWVCACGTFSVTTFRSISCGKIVTSNNPLLRVRVCVFAQVCDHVSRVLLEAYHQVVLSWFKLQNQLDQQVIWSPETTQ